MKPDSLPQTITELAVMARNANRLPPEFTTAQAEKIARVFRNNVNLHIGYHPLEWSGPLLLIRALRRNRMEDLPPDWSPYLLGNFTQIDLNCEHNELVSSALAPIIAQHVAPLLAMAQPQRDVFADVI